MLYSLYGIWAEYISPTKQEEHQNSLTVFSVIVTMQITVAAVQERTRESVFVHSIHIRLVKSCQVTRLWINVIDRVQFLSFDLAKTCIVLSVLLLCLIKALIGDLDLDSKGNTLHFSFVFLFEWGR